MIYFALIIFAIIPSFVWLLYYLQEDENPEPNHLIFYVFLVGILSGIIAFFLQPALRLLIASIYYSLFIEKFILVAFLEEFLKYLAVFFTMSHDTELDEPIDLVIYMIIAALGFAALENFIYLHTLGPNFLIREMVVLTALRFLGSTFLHVLASGVLGIFLAYAYRANRSIIIVYGLLVATTLHAIYNMIVLRMENSLFIFLLIFFLASMAIALSVGIKKVRSMKSISLPG